MSETKLTIDQIEVPEQGFLNAWAVMCSRCNNVSAEDFRAGLNAFALYLAENPIVPSAKDVVVFRDECNWTSVDTSFAVNFSPWWQRRMFLRREPELPQEFKSIACVMAHDGRFERGNQQERVIAAKDYARQFYEASKKAVSK